MPGVSFDFALGHTSEEKVWVDTYPISVNVRMMMEIAIINAEIIAEGLAEVDKDNAGKT